MVLFVTLWWININNELDLVDQMEWEDSDKVEIITL